MNTIKLDLEKFQPIVKYYFLMDILSILSILNKILKIDTISFNFGYLIVRLDDDIKTL